MTKDEIREIVFQVLSSIAPEADFSSLREDEELREILDLDSMDFLNFLTGLHEATGINIPEADYSKLATLGDAIDYLAKADA